jgi:hypothetical protein
MSMSVSIFNFVKKRKKSERSRRIEKILVFKCTAFSINSPKCRLSSNEPMTTIISLLDIELKLKSSTNSSKSSMKLRKRRLMTNSKEFLRLRRS